VLISLNLLMEWLGLLNIYYKRMDLYKLQIMMHLLYGILVLFNPQFIKP